MHYTWDLAIRKTSQSDKDLKELALSDFKIVRNPYKKKWFADPFILNYDGKIAKVLVEEFDSDVNRGRIALLTIDVKNAIILNCKIVLDIDTHLSYPIIYRHKDRIIIAPENADSGHADFYEYNIDDDTISYLQKYSDEPLADATILNLDNNYYCFSTKLPYPNGRVLNISKSGDLLGDYEKIQDYEFQSCIARMGGDFFKDERGNIIRPAQDCNGDYGRKILFQKVNFNDDHFSFSTVGELVPRGYKYAGLHTFNQSPGLQIIDLKKYDFPIIYYLKNLIKR